MGAVGSLEGVGAGIIRKEGGVDFSNFVSPRYVVVIVLHGRGIYTDERGRQYRLDAGFSFQRQPGTAHSNSIEAGSGWVEAYVECGPLLYQSLRAMRLVRTDRPVQRVDNAPDLMQRVWRLIHALRDAGEDSLGGLTVMAMDLLLRCQRNAEAILPRRETESVIELACRILGSDFAGTVDMHEFCAGHGWGYEHFRKAFKARIGVSPWQYRIRRKLDAASAMLQDRHRTITEISEILGYSSVYEFSAHFKRHIGVSPLFYRRGRGA